MKTTAVFFSPTGTSKAGAETIARTISPDAISWDLTRFDAPLPAPFDADDLVIFGASVYAGRLYEGFAARLTHLRGNHTPCILTVTYGNRHYDDALLEMNDIVRRVGFVPFAAAALVAQHTYGEIQVGRPNADDLAEDRAFAAQAMEKLTKGDLHPIAVPGSRPYCEGVCAENFARRQAKPASDAVYARANVRRARLIHRMSARSTTKSVFPVSAASGTAQRARKIWRNRYIRPLRRIFLPSWRSAAKMNIFYNWRKIVCPPVSTSSFAPRMQ